MSTESSASGARERCEECGLPYYDDEHDRCPYCAQATPETEPATTDSPTQAQAESATATEGDSSDRSLRERITEGVRNVLGG